MGSEGHFESGSLVKPETEASATAMVCLYVPNKVLHRIRAIKQAKYSTRSPALTSGISAVVDESDLVTLSASGAEMWPEQPCQGRRVNMPPTPSPLLLARPCPPAPPPLLPLSEMAESQVPVSHSLVGILGLTWPLPVSDIRPLAMCIDQTLVQLAWLEAVNKPGVGAELRGLKPPALGEGWEDGGEGSHALACCSRPDGVMARLRGLNLAWDREGQASGAASGSVRVIGALPAAACCAESEFLWGEERERMGAL